MKKTIFALFVLLSTLSANVNAQSLDAFTWDKKGKFTNVRNAPNGKIVDRIPTSEAAMIGIERPTNGWWRIVGNGYESWNFACFQAVNGRLEGTFHVFSTITFCRIFAVSLGLKRRNPACRQGLPC